ncbi:hypothetical protein BJ138DRAFT_1107255 [Hygrophoropsis aurantiaca]|uniref:Uncharacterized protein n=1 Tax=Hygrophoropsis aurantiaca TaxID=72124 RepID=A0ACB7ZSV1_9AGAM|nr:hypothetical protein BJ138DRAFT_1107255 [Hygrophoropsis aurantiaca]
MKKLPPFLKRMLKIAKKYNINFNTCLMSKEIQHNLPVWFHIGANKDLNPLNNHTHAKCLRSKHNISTVGDLEKIANRNDRTHRVRKNCNCEDCKADRDRGCMNPYRCKKTARMIMASILPKWNPSITITPPRRDLNPNEVLEASIAFKKQDDITFNPFLVLEGHPENGLRILGNKIDRRDNLNISQERVPDSQEVAVAVICEANRIDRDGMNVSAGGVWFGPSDDCNTYSKVPEEIAKQGSGAIQAILKATQLIPKNTPLKMKIQDRALIKTLTIDLQKAEDEGWTNTPNKELTKIAVQELRKRSAITHFRLWGKDISANDKKGATDLAKRGLDAPQTDTYDLQPDLNYAVEGIKLVRGSQRLFYKGIRNISGESKQRRGTLINLAMTKYAVHDIGGKTPADAEIWKAIRNRDIPRQIRGFVWKTIHEAYKIGKYWTRIENLENRGKCDLCGEEENMDHVLLDCDKSLPIKTVWDLSKKIWLLREESWPDISFGTIIGSCLVNFTNNKKKKLIGKNRLF